MAYGKPLSVLMILPAADFSYREYITIKKGLTGKGLDVVTASESPGFCRGDNGSIVQPDIRFYNIHPVNFRGMIIIGGKGILEYENSPLFHKVTEEFFNSGKPLGAICAASFLLAGTGLLKGKEFTCYPDYHKKAGSTGAKLTDLPVVASGNVVTGRDPSAAGEFVTAINVMLQGT